ncbi:putative flagellar assembly protein FliH [Clostridium argentinense CDC 2741]|uniref:Putative flagellar assembly protein FliH n=2 Tax=Clostridium argentinense TaxID=29341 RepID=A0A0C1R0A0_9CLOT|nr:hypothetical protein [Clostridium argentinense]ARC85304.1 hypothetical protein RSJ17_12745 [Clostridium argentinense]KIE46832.1 putative flagellar assembly protein FliH [Clostridium argentinense CDC 2741]NFF40926.1 flagellar assembly protein FliH [Clostridium argentinense]NFP51363.1 flagellar assembly protein FliH [Clostridium argentinense]NFP73401.1 flagellar assembly protein FliH [Clostridium argentinense]
MQSSYNVIKNHYVVTEGKKEICTKAPLVIDDFEAEQEEKIENTIENTKEALVSFKNIARDIVENAHIESNKIIVEATERAKEIEVEAFNNASSKGYDDGYNIGYKEGMEKAVAEGEAIIKNANKVLVNAKLEYKNYIEEKEIHIRELIYQMTSSVLKREVEDSEAINEIIFDALLEEKNEEYFIIKCNSNHLSSLKGEVENMKNKLAFTGDIFVIEDNSLDNGAATIEKGSGKILVDMGYVCEKLKEIIFER